MTQDILIVGLKHFLSEEERIYLLDNLTPRHEITLLLTDDNPVDKNAIQVWMPFNEQGRRLNKQIGFVSSDHTDLIHYNYPDARTMIVSGAHRNEGSDSTFFIAMEIESVGVNYPESNLDFTPIAGVPIPYLNQDYQLSLQQIKKGLMDMADELDGEDIDESVAHAILRIAEDFEQIYGQSLNGEEQAAYFQLTSMIDVALTYPTKQAEELQIAQDQIRAIRKRFAKEEDRFVEVMHYEMTMVRALTKPFFKQVKQALDKKLYTLEEQQRLNEEWLRQLPDNLYLWIDKEQELAQRLFYEKFSVEDLYAIYLHLVYREKLQQENQCPLEEAILKQRIHDFHYWGYQCTTYEEQFAAVSAWREALKVKQWVSQLAMVIKQQRKHHVLRDDLFPLNVLAEEMSGILNREIKANSLQRHFKGEKFPVKDDYMFSHYKRPPMKREKQFEQAAKIYPKSTII